MVSELRDIDFEKISRLVYEKSGINLHAGKKELVKARLGKRLREGNFKSFADYYRYVTTEMGINELITMIDSISTNLTSFFREETHFRKLREVIPALIETSGNGCSVPGLKIWSAGCSTGEEPYSLAIILKEIIKDRNCKPKILATDISTRTLRIAVAGVYSKEKIKKIPPLLLRKYFQIGQGRWDGHYRVKKELKDSVEFMRFNLMEIPAFNDPFDIIFCRNVMIYFDKKTQDGLVNRFYDSLKKGGYFFVGHSESLTGLTHRFKYVEPSVYRKG
ncbi:MAG: protein-glutamate O-methyltransferase [Thermodesulfobacteriota bacterium]|nr:protein-glutamate O-methyltransferase [Thermodesulfobacteriota bacterium]